AIDVTEVEAKGREVEAQLSPDLATLSPRPARAPLELELEPLTLWGRAAQGLGQIEVRHGDERVHDLASLRVALRDRRPHEGPGLLAAWVRRLLEERDEVPSVQDVELLGDGSDRDSRHVARVVGGGERGARSHAEECDLELGVHA